MAVLIFEILLKKDTKPPQGALECSLGRIYLQVSIEIIISCLGLAVI